MTNALFLLVGSGGSPDTVKNVKDYGAIGDGTNHFLNERFATLTAAQAVYPHATNIATDTLDWAAIVGAVNDTTAPYSVANRGTIFFPNSVGPYQISGPIPYQIADGITAISFIGALGAKIRGDFPDAILKRSPDAFYGPIGGTYIIERLQIENNNAAGKGITFHTIVGGTIRNCNIGAFIGIETYNSQSVTIQDCSVIPGGVGGASIGIIAGNATSILSTDVTGYSEGVRHSNAGLIIHGGRFEVNTVAIKLGVDPDGVNFNSSGVDICGISMESNTTGFYLNSCVNGSIRGCSPGGAQTGLAYGYRLFNVADTEIVGAAFGTVHAWSGHAMSLEGPIARLTLSSIHATNDVGGDDWNVAAGCESFTLNNCNVELIVAQLPAGARVGTVMPVKDATVTTAGTTVVGGGSNHVSVVRSAGVWRII